MPLSTYTVARFNFINELILVHLNCVGSRNGKYNGGVSNGNGSIHYDNGPVYSGLSTGPRPAPALYQAWMLIRSFFGITFNLYSKKCCYNFHVDDELYLE